MKYEYDQPGRIEPNFCHKPFLYRIEKIRETKLMSPHVYITLQFVAFHFHSVLLNRKLKIYDSS